MMDCIYHLIIVCLTRRISKMEKIEWGMVQGQRILVALSENPHGNAQQLATVPS